MPDVTSVTPNRMFTVHTTHSWDFLGLNDNSKDNTLLQKANYGEDIIIGVIDSGYILSSCNLGNGCMYNPYYMYAHKKKYSFQYKLTSSEVFENFT